MASNMQGGYERMKKFLVLLTACTAALIASVATSPSAISQVQTDAKTLNAPSPHPFVKKRYSIRGEWSVTENDGQTQIKFSDDFGTKGGPDLKVYLSKLPIEKLDSKSASSGTVSIGVLKAKSGGQIYTVPEDINISDYKSVIIHCEAFSVLWGGFNLPVPTSTTP